MKIDTYYRQPKCTTVASFWKYKVYEDIRRGSSGWGHQTTVGFSPTAIVGDFHGYF